MMAYELLKTACVPLNYESAKNIINKFQKQREIEKQASILHEKAQNMRLEIQKELNIDCAKYYQIINCN